jgi:hypothetical protein
MRLLARLENEPESCAAWYITFRHSPNVSIQGETTPGPSFFGV